MVSAAAYFKLEIKQLANMAKSKARKKISQKSKDLNFINQMKISKQIKEELLRCTKSHPKKMV